MIVLGLILVVVAAGFAIGLLSGNGGQVPLHWYGLTFDGSSVLFAYLAGVVSMLLLLAGLWLVKRGVNRMRARRRAAPDHGAMPARLGKG